MTTPPTINGKSYNLAQVIETALSNAADGYVCPPDQAHAALYPNVPDAARRLTLARYITQQIGLSVDWQKLNPDDLLGSLAEIVARRNKRAGVRALKSKYGHAAAERIVSKHAGRPITLK